MAFAPAVSFPGGGLNGASRKVKYRGGGLIQVPGKQEKKRRKALLQQHSDQQRRAALTDLPLPLSELNDLFDFLDLHMGESGCDHTLQGTRRFLQLRNLDADTIIPWLANSGGFCDCEVLANVEDAWDSN